MSPKRVFVDSGAWFAVKASDDSHHETAKETEPYLIGAGHSLITSNLVIGETYTLLRVTRTRTRDYCEAKTFLDKSGETAKLQILSVTPNLERQAYEILHQYSDHPFSFVDGTSFALMRHHRIRYAFAFDSHFATAGFLRVPLDVKEL